MPSKPADSFENYILTAQKDINGHLQQFVKNVPLDIRPMYAHVLTSSAKRFRPLLICIASDLFKLSWSETIAFRQAIELFHTASLIFDDLPAQDNAHLRRGKPTLHTIFLEGEAQVAGLAMLFDANHLIALADSQGHLNGALAKYVSKWLGSQGLCLGQMKDLRTFGIELDQITEEFLDEITILKTGSLLKICLAGTAIIAQQPQTIEALEAFALDLSIIFQIQDDLLDSQNEQISGKSKHLDDQNKKVNYIHLLGLQKARAKQAHHKQEAEKVLQGLQFDTSQFIKVLNFVAKANS